MSEAHFESLGFTAPTLSLFRLYTRGVTVREDYEWRREIGEALNSEEAEVVGALFELLNRQRGRILRRWALWRSGERLHALLFDVPSARKDHVKRPIVSHLHCVLESAPLSASLTLSELTRRGLGAALLALTQAHSTQDSPVGLIDLLDELMSSSDPSSSLEALSSRLLEILAPPLEPLEELFEEVTQTAPGGAQEVEVEVSRFTPPSFMPTAKGMRDLSRLQGSPFARRWRDERRRGVWMSKVSEVSALEGSELPLWWLMTERSGACFVCDELSLSLSEELTSLIKSPWWVLTHQAGAVYTQEPKSVWREPLLTSLSRRFMR